VKSRQFIFLAPLALVALVGAACSGSEAAEPGVAATSTVVATAPSPPVSTPESATDLPTSAAEPGRVALVGGILTYLEKIALPADAVITVRLVDVSLQDVAGITLAETTFPADGRQVPFEYVMQYDPNDVVQNGTYAIQAEVRVGGELWFATDTHYPAITGGAPSNPEIVLVRVLA